MLEMGFQLVFLGDTGQLKTMLDQGSGKAEACLAHQETKPRELHCWNCKARATDSAWELE